MMKRILFLLTIVLLASLNVYSQHRGDRHKEAREKVEQLEKIKLIETLNMDEQTTLKFFARRNEFMKNVRELNEKQDNLLSKLDDNLKSGKENNDTYYQSIIDQYFGMERKIFELRQNFTGSLSDILTKEQIAKLIVFQKKFREEIRDILFKSRILPEKDH